MGTASIRFVFRLATPSGRYAVSGGMQTHGWPAKSVVAKLVSRDYFPSHADGLLIIERLPSVRNTRALPNWVERPLCFPRIR